MSKSDVLIKNALGDDFYESLQKFELWKPGTRTTLDHEEIKTALQIVPRVIMSLMISELTPMKVGEAKEIDLMVGNNTILKVTKHERDVYSGTIDEDNKVVVDFKYRSIPGVALVIMSAFEMYDQTNFDAPAPAEQPDVQKLIDDRLALHKLVENVVEGKLQQRDAIQQLIMAKLTEAIHQQAPVPAPVQNTVVIVEAPKTKKPLPLKEFLEKAKAKKPNEFKIELAKGEHVHCPDCGKNIFDGKLFSGCICLGDDMDRKVFIKKSEDGFKVRFSKGWDPENIELLVETLRKQNA